MLVQVVQESLFGNTRAVADAVADGLRESGCEVVIDQAGPDTPVRQPDLLLVLGPTHALGMTRPASRADAVQRGARGRADAGIREWLATLPARDPAATAFACADTRSAPRIPGSAARAAHRRLRRRGYRPVAAPRSFWVAGTSGPLRDGELDRAREWGRELALARSAAR
jgi:hypothetical protein